ncbi:MAG: radical SAM protein [Myxococcota bacterium]
MANILFIKTTKSESNVLMAASPPLGILYLIAYLREHRSGDNFKLLDLRVARGNRTKLVKRTINEFKPDIIAFSSLTVEAENLYEKATICKESAPNTPIVVGGPHPSAFGEKTLAHSAIDFIIAGEGEIPFLKLVNALESGESEPEITGIGFRKNGGAPTLNAPNRELVDLATLPMPAWDMIDFEAYKDYRMVPVGRGRYASLFTSRGCPYRCTYCHQIFTKRYRAAPPEKVVQEIEHIVNAYGIDEFEIYDDTFNLDYKRTEAICDEIINRGLKIRICFPNGVRGDILDENLIKKLRKAGTIHMAIAVESASERIQREIKKNNKLDKLKENISLAAQEGIFTWGFFMMGFPGETREELWKTAKFALTSDLQGAYFFTVIPQEGTELAEQAKVSVAKYKNLKAADYLITNNALAAVGNWELWAWQMATTFAFHYHPKRIYMMMRNYPYSKRFFFKKGFLFTFRYFPEMFLTNLYEHIRKRLPS